METVSIFFKFGQLTPWSQTLSQITVTRNTDRILELPELKEYLKGSKKLEHTYYNPDTDKLEILGASKTKEGANLSEF